MTIMEIVANLNLLYLSLTKAKELKELTQDNEFAVEMMSSQMDSLKRAIQILVSIDLKNEVENMEEKDG